MRENREIPAKRGKIDWQPVLFAAKLEISGIE